MSEFSVCILIPCRNHAAALAGVLENLEKTQLDIIVIDDASDAGDAKLIDALPAKFPRVTLLRHTENKGKGVAVVTGFREASRRGFSHALQIDADGQHDAGAVPAFLAEAKKFPEALISGKPIYDSSVPKGRLYGRYVTHAWVWFQTLSFQIEDSMCGLRVYPLAPVMRLLGRRNVGAFMDFDTDIIVRLFWENVPVRFLPVRVIYPEGGRSNFRSFRDNARISLMHARLVCEMPFRLPALFFKKISAGKNDTHWSEIKERRGVFGIRVLLFVYAFFGRRVFRALLFCVISFYRLTGRRAREASADYLRRLKIFADARGVALPEKLSTQRHFLNFGESLLDKIAAWRGEFSPAEFAVIKDAQVDRVLGEKRGALILASHLGNFEFCRALAARGGLKINILTFTEHAEQFNRLLHELAPDSGINLISTKTLGPETAILLREKIDAGEWVAITADRTSATNPGRLTRVDFLGAPAAFPQGAFVLAAALRCPVFLVFGLKESGGKKIRIDFFADPLEIRRSTRTGDLERETRRFAEKLEENCLRAPLDWFNFYNFWENKNVYSGNEH